MVYKKSLKYQILWHKTSTPPPPKVLDWEGLSPSPHFWGVVGTLHRNIHIYTHNRVYSKNSLRPNSNEIF